MSRPTEPCISCARDTATGSRLFADRRTERSDDGSLLPLCGDCNERAVSHAGRTLDRNDMLKIAARASGLGFAARSGAGAGGAGSG
jgi:hypothetical protein